jgi:hypothetical protein
VSVVMRRFLLSASSKTLLLAASILVAIVSAATRRFLLLASSKPHPLIALTPIYTDTPHGGLPVAHHHVSIVYIVRRATNIVNKINGWERNNYVRVIRNEEQQEDQDDHF